MAPPKKKPQDKKQLFTIRIYPKDKAKLIKKFGSVQKAINELVKKELSQ